MLEEVHFPFHSSLDHLQSVIWHSVSKEGTLRLQGYFKCMYVEGLAQWGMCQSRKSHGISSPVNGGRRSKHHWRDFPSGPVVKNLPCDAGDASSIPGQGTKSPHAMEQRSPLSTTTELMHHN